MEVKLSPLFTSPAQRAHSIPFSSRWYIASAVFAMKIVVLICDNAA